MPEQADRGGFAKPGLVGSEARRAPDAPVRVDDANRRGIRPILALRAGPCGPRVFGAWAQFQTGGALWVATGGTDGPPPPGGRQGGKGPPPPGAAGREAPTVTEMGGWINERAPKDPPDPYHTNNHESTPSSGGRPDPSRGASQRPQTPPGIPPPPGTSAGGHIPPAALPAPGAVEAARLSPAVLHPVIPLPRPRPWVRPAAARTRSRPRPPPRPAAPSRPPGPKPPRFAPPAPRGTRRPRTCAPRPASCRS